MSEQDAARELLISWVNKEECLIGEFGGSSEEYRKLISDAKRWAIRLGIVWTDDIVSDSVWDDSRRGDAMSLLEPLSVRDYLAIQEEYARSGERHSGTSEGKLEEDSWASTISTAALCLVMCKCGARCTEPECHGDPHRCPEGHAWESASGIHLVDPFTAPEND